MNAHLDFAPTASYLSRIAEPALRTLIVAGAAGVSLAALKISGTKARLAVWRGVLGVAVAMPLLSFLLPSLQVAVPLIQKSPVAREAVTPVLPPVFTGKFDLTQAAQMAAVRDAVRDDVRASEYKLEAEARASRATRSTRAFTAFANTHNAVNVLNTSEQASAKSGLITRFVDGLIDRAKRELTFTRAMAIVYLAGLVCLGARMFTGIVLGSRLARKAKTIRNPRAIQHLDQCADALGLRESPRLAESEALTVPVTFGVVDTAILLPVNWPDWTDAQLDSVLLHELSHVERRDAFSERVSLVHRAIFWFSPLSWWLDRELAKLAEQASDEAALASGINREQYAETLLGFLTALHSAPGRVRWQGVSMAASGQAEKRMERILRWKGESEMTLKKSAVLAIVAACVPVVCLASAFSPRFERIYIDQDSTTAPQAQAPSQSQASGTGASAAPSSAPSNSTSPNPSSAPSSSAAPDASRTRVYIHSDQGAGMVLAPMPPMTPPTADNVLVMRDNVIEAPHAVVAMPYPGAPAPRVYSYAVPAPQAPGAPVTVYAAPNVHVTAPVAIKVMPMPRVTVDPHITVDAKSATRIYMRPEALQRSTMVIRTDERSDSYVIVNGKTSYSVIAGPDDIEIINDGENSQVQELRAKHGDHFIWFRLNGKEYVITDAATVERAMSSFDKMNELGKQQEALGAQQEALGKQQEQLGELQSQAFVNMPDLTKQMDELNAEMKKLDTPENRAAMAQAQANLDKAISQLNVNSPDMEQQLAKLQAEANAFSSKVNAEALTHIQEQMGELQEKLGEAQGEAGESQGKLGELQGKLGEKQGELGEKQGELGQQQEKAEREAQHTLRKLFQDSVTNGTAKPQ
jgi:beta-lactamase regulating signal transducer with metallopeptidase domain